MKTNANVARHNKKIMIGTLLVISESDNFPVLPLSDALSPLGIDGILSFVLAKYRLEGAIALRKWVHCLLCLGMRSDLFMT